MNKLFSKTLWQFESVNKDVLCHLGFDCTLWFMWCLVFSEFSQINVRANITVFAGFYMFAFTCCMLTFYRWLFHILLNWTEVLWDPARNFIPLASSSKYCFQSPNRGELSVFKAVVFNHLQWKLDDMFRGDTFLFFYPNLTAMKTMHLNMVVTISFSHRIGWYALWISFRNLRGATAIS